MSKLSKLDYMKREVIGLLGGSCRGIYCDLTDRNRELLELQGYKQWGTTDVEDNIYAIDKRDSDIAKEYIPIQNDGEYIKFSFEGDGEPYFNDERYKIEAVPQFLTTEEIDALLDIAEQGEQEEAETESKEENITQLSAKKYLVSVVGGKAPKHIHNSLESAEKEAKRLASKEIGKAVMVLEYVKSYQAKVIVEEIVETDNSKALKQKDKEIKALKKELADKINELNMTRSTFQKKLNKIMK